MAVPINDETRAAISQGVQFGVTAAAWYEGRYVCDLEVGPGGVWKRNIASQSVTSTITLPVLDPSGELSRLDIGAPLQPFGQQISVSVLVNNQAVPIGRFRITDTGYGGPMSSVMVGSTVIPSGRELHVEGTDLLVELADEQLIDPFGTLGGTVLAESARVLGGVLPLGKFPDIVSGSVGVPSGVTYEGTRLTALSGVLANGDLMPHIDRSGAMSPLPRTPKGPTQWELAPQNTTIDTPKISQETIYNAVVITSTDENNAPLRGQAFIELGPLRWGGPHGRKVLTENNPLMKSQGMVTAAAQTRLQSITNTRAITMGVTTPANPAMDLMDICSFQMDGAQLTGPVTSIDLPLNGGMMHIQIAVPWRQLVKGL